MKKKLEKKVVRFLVQGKGVVQKSTQLIYEITVKIINRGSSKKLSVNGIARLKRLGAACPFYRLHHLRLCTEPILLLVIELMGGHTYK